MAYRSYIRFNADYAVASVLAVAVLILFLMRSSWTGMADVPEGLVLPLISWLDSAARALVGFDFGPFSVQGFTRGLAAALSVLLAFTEEAGHAVGSVGGSYCLPTTFRDGGWLRT